MQTLHDLLQSCASHLTGRDVILDWRPVTGGYGQTWCDQSGVLRIDIRPDLDDDRLLKTFLHECGHGLLHKFTRRSEDEIYSTDADDPPDQRARQISRIREYQADSLSLRWMKYGLDHRDQTLPLVEGVLWSLLRGDIRRMARYDS